MHAHNHFPLHHSTSDMASNSRSLMARDPIPASGDITSFGIILNDTLTHEAGQYTHGLTGVNQVLNWALTNALVGSFLALLALTFFYRWLHVGSAHVRQMVTMGRDTDQRYWMYNHSEFWARAKNQIMYAPLSKVRHNRELQLSKAISIGTLPSRFHTVLLVVYLISNIAYCLALDFSHNTSAAVVAEMRGRTGLLATLNIIPTVLFALRNNPLIPILQVSYDSMNLLHRWCARVVILEGTVHTLCWAVNTLNAGGLEQLNLTLSTSLSYRAGMIGMCAFGFVFIASLSPLRHAFYETFLNGHRAMVGVAMIGVYIHLDAAGLPGKGYMQLCFALWLFEWVWRSARIIYYNVSRKTGITRVTVEALPAEACRVTFELARPWSYQPGCHVHAYLPTFAFWSSHPFSVAWADTKPIGTEKDVKELDGTLGASSPEKQGPTILREKKATSVSLVMRARTGMTKKLFDRASAAPGNKLVTWGALEGPYGGHHPMTSYGTVILFAGGVGITHCVGYIQYLIKQYQLGTSSTQKILLVWSVPNTDALEWVRMWMDQILRMEGRRDVLRVQLFISKPRHRGDVVSSTGSVQMFAGRCKPETVLEKEMPERIGAMGITVCGPGAFADSVRKAAREQVQEGFVDFIEEAFTY